MAASKLNEVIQHVRRVVLLRDDGGLTDGQLMDEYLNHQEEAALAVLVRRHGAMVWGVCSRTLRNSHDAEDAFQSTFLVFVRKAASVVPKEMIGNWLYGVAHQTALNARATADRRRKRERPVSDMPETPLKNTWHDMLPFLDQELSRLPDKYRAAIVLCDLEGKTRQEAAKQLGVPDGTLASRLAKARTMLAKRLARHGGELSGGALAAVLSQNRASADVPPLVVTTAIQAVTSIAAGQAATGVISAKVAALTEGVLKTMLLKQLKAVAAILLVLGSVVTYGGGQVLTHYSETAQQVEKVEKKTSVQTKKEASDATKKNAQIGVQVSEKKSITNSIGMKFVWIKPGNFVMGSPPNEEGAIKSENDLDETQHKVTLTKGFYMGVYTVTQEQWQAVMGNNPSVFKGEKNLPVENVTWDDCQEFIKKLREKDKRPYRLPTEAEWEFACRAGTTTPFHFGKTITTDQANLNGTSYNGTATYDGDFKKGVFRNKTTPVGNFPANAWGLHDMHGNVWQWCQDWFGDYPQNNVVDPQRAEYTGPNTEEYRVLRGGSFIHYPISCTSGRRNRLRPDLQSGNNGCRLCFFVE